MNTSRRFRREVKKELKRLKEAETRRTEARIRWTPRGVPKTGLEVSRKIPAKPPWEWVSFGVVADQRRGTFMAYVVQKPLGRLGTKKTVLGHNFKTKDQAKLAAERALPRLMRSRV